MGFVTTIMIAFGERCAAEAETFFTTSALISNRASRLCPAFLGIPEVITIISEPAVSSYPFVPPIFVLYPITGPASIISSALPWGMPSVISTSTTSASCASTIRCARVAPTLPAPTTVTFFLIYPPPHRRHSAWSRVQRVPCCSVTLCSMPFALCPLLYALLKFHDLYLADLSTLDLQNLELEVPVLELFAHFRHPAEEPEHESADGIEILRLEMHVEQFVHLVEGGLA